MTSFVPIYILKIFYNIELNFATSKQITNIFADSITMVAYIFF